MTSDQIIPRGMFFCGFWVSSLAVETASKPMYEKNPSAAPCQMPLKPLGANGVQFGAVRRGKMPMAMNASDQADLDARP